MCLLSRPCASDKLLRPQYGPKMVQESPKRGSRGPQDGPKRPPREPQEGHRRPTNLRLGALLERSWGALGRFGAVFGPSWAPLGALLDHLGAILRPQKLIGSQKARRQQTYIFLWLLKVFGFLGASLGGSKGTWNRLGLSWAS